MESSQNSHLIFKSIFTKPKLVVPFIITLATITFISHRVFDQAGDLMAYRDGVLEPEVKTCSGFYVGSGKRNKVVSIRDFGGVGDGKTSNTEAFRAAIKALKEKGGGRLNVPFGRWLTGTFNLTSNFTLFLEEGAVILGSQDPNEWPLVEPLPSYGRGREPFVLGPRRISLVHGNGLHDVVITGDNGTIDGQGNMWWEMWWNQSLDHTRGHLVELMYSNNILISNLTFQNSPFWTVHPVYCSNVVITKMTVLAPFGSPNTDGIDPDSSNNVCIEDCYIESGDDLVALKSGWDEYGTAMNRSCSNIVIRRISGTTPKFTGIGIGSEMSGGISNITIEDIFIRDANAGVKIKTDKGRGGYIENITINNIILERVQTPIMFTRGAKDHPDEGWDRNAIPIVKGIFISNVLCVNSTRAPSLKGIKDAPYQGICMRNFTILGLSPSTKWYCEFVSGFTEGVSPEPCPELRNNNSSSWCSFS